jgi:hypothetical protein
MHIYVNACIDVHTYICIHICIYIHDPNPNLTLGGLNLRQNQVLKNECI